MCGSQGLRICVWAGQLGSAYSRTCAFVFTHAPRCVWTCWRVCVNTQSTGARVRGVYPQVAVLQTVLSRVHTCVQVLCRSPSLQLRAHLCTLIQRRHQVLSSVLAGESTCTVHSMVYTVQ